MPKQPIHAADIEILEDFKRCRQKTIDLLKRVPPKLLKCKAAGEDQTTGELFHHLAAVVDNWMYNSMKDGGDEPAWSVGMPRSKASLEKSLRASQKRLLKFFETNDGDAMSNTFRGIWHFKKNMYTGRNRVLYLTHHEAHHRGKIVLALRQWGFGNIPLLPFE